MRLVGARSALFLSLIVLTVSKVDLAAQSASGGIDLRVISGTPLEKDYSEMLFNYLLRQADQATEKREARLAAIHSENDFRNWQEGNRQKFLELIGGLPNRRSDLNAHVTGEITRPGYALRKVIFESLPEFYVTADLYVPTLGKPPYPAVLSPCGHSRNGKAYDVYQRLFIGLANRGYVVLTYDPPGQGERIEYWDFLSSRRRFEFNQHGMAGIQEYLLGQNLARYFIWDGIRALDYLTGLPEVDPSRIGVTGNSGGGTLTTYISMLDPRVKVASIVTYLTSIRKKIEARALDAESDPEQDVQGLLAAGLDHTEFAGMIAPRPVLIGAARRDFFPIEGTRKTYAELRQLYSKLGVPERVKMVEFDQPHEYSQRLREATYAWFDRWLKGTETEPHEGEIVTERDSTIECTPTGQVATSLGGKRIYDFNRAEAEDLLRALDDRRRDPSFGRELAGRIRERLVLPSGRVEPLPRRLSENEVGGLVVEKWLLETEPGVVVPVRILRPENSNGRLPAVVWLRDRAGEADQPEIFKPLARQGRVVAVADARGFGETRSRQSTRRDTDYFDPRDGTDADYTYASFFLGRPLLGMRVWDALHVAEYVRSRAEVDAQRVVVVGRGWAGVTGALAAALDSKISGAALEETPVSYAAMARSELYEQPVSLMLPGVLQDFDFPDILGALAPRPLLVLNPQDALTKKMAREEAEQAVALARQTYQAAHDVSALEVRVAPVEADAGDALKNWLLRR